MKKAEILADIEQFEAVDKNDILGDIQAFEAEKQAAPRAQYHGFDEGGMGLVGPADMDIAQGQGLLNAMAKPQSVATGAIRQTYADGDPLMAELTSIAPTEEGSFQKDLGLPGMALDVGLGMATGKAFGAVAPMMRNKAIENTGEALLKADIPTSLRRELIESPKLGEKTDLRKIAETTERFNLIPFLTNKTKMLRKLTGDIVNGVKVTPGLIGQKADELTAALSEVSTNVQFTGGKKDLIPRLAQTARERLRQNLAPVKSGFEYNESIDNVIDKTINSFLKPSEMPYTNDYEALARSVLRPDKGPSKLSEATKIYPRPKPLNPNEVENTAKNIEGTLNNQFERMNPAADELIRLKRAAQAEAYAHGKHADLGVADAKSKQMIYNELWKVIDEEIYSMAERLGPEKSAKIAAANRDLSDLISLENVIKDAPIMGLPSGAEVAAGGAAGYGIGMAAGVSNPIVAAGIYPAARAASKNLTINIPSLAAKGQNLIAQTAPTIGAGIMTGGVANAVQNFRIPRNTKDIVANFELVRAKMGEIDPMAVAMFDKARSPQELTGLMQQLALTYPQHFAEDEYMRFDGIITDPVLKRRALKDIINSGDSNLIKAKKSQNLLHNSTLEG